MKVLRDLSQNLPKQARYRKNLWNALDFRERKGGREGVRELKTSATM